MPWQNRVDPYGRLVASEARGTLTGNRGGRLHRPDRTLGSRRWVSRAWICCELRWKAARRDPMGDGYTSLFFLDEVTALAAGHRPCWTCRRDDARAFVASAGAASAPELDRRVHPERTTSPRPTLALDAVPDGAMVEHDGRVWAIREHHLIEWTLHGYLERRPRWSGRVVLLTPPSYLAALSAGYRPRWHPSAGGPADGDAVGDAASSEPGPG